MKIGIWSALQSYVCRSLPEVVAASIFWRSALVVLLLAGSPIVSEAEVRGVNDRKPNILEQSRLPEYCLWQFNRNNPEYQAPKFVIHKVFPGCKGINHFCPGIVYFIRSGAPGASKQHRNYWLQEARAGFNYTFRAIKDTPKCGLHEHLAFYRKQVDILSGPRKRS